MLPGVIGSGEGGIAAVVGGDDQQIFIPHEGLNLRQLLIKVLQCLSKAFRIVTVTVSHVVVHQIGEAQAIKILAHIVKPSFNAGRVSGSVIGAGQSLMIKNVLNFAYAKAFHAGSLHLVQQRFANGRQGEIPTAGRAGEVAGFAYERTGNDTANTELTLQHFPSNGAEAVQLLAGIQAFVAGNLEHAVCRGVDNRLAGSKMLCTQLVQNSRAGSRLIANGSMTNGSFILGHKISREAVRESGEGFCQPQTADFPVAGGGVLTCTFFNGSTIAAHCIRIGRIACRRNLAKTKLSHVRQAGMALCYHMGNGGSTNITIFICVRQIACANTVKDGQKNTSHSSYPPFKHFVMVSKQEARRGCNAIIPCV